MGKKNLEQLFKEKFEAFQEVPDEKVWESIEASLDKKKQKRRIVPIWWRLGGVAAVLAVLFYVINPFDGEPGNEKIIITETEDNGNPTQNVDRVNGNKDFELPVNGKDEQTLTESEGGAIKSGKDLNPVNKGSKSTDSGEQFVENDSKAGEYTRLEQRKPSDKIANNKDNNAIAMMDNSAEDNVSENQKKSPGQIIPEGRKDKEAIAENRLKEQGLDSNDVPNVLEIQKEEKETVAQNKEEEKEVGKKSIFEAIAEQEEEAQVAEGSTGKWSVGPSVAPVYFNATGDGSPIHSSFASNSKSGNINLSYGLTVGYDIGKRLKIRTGVHKVNYGYDTNDVIFSSSFGASQNDMIDNISYSQTSRTLIVQSKKASPGNFSNDASVEVSANEATALEGKMIQQLGYIEVPLELNYTLVDKKFGVDLIGGVSSLFLVDNSVLVESEDLITEVGQANNANSINYSTNVGLGLNYEFSPKVQLNVDPVFKYHLNTFSQTSGSFRPFSVGVYSGISFKF